MFSPASCPMIAAIFAAAAAPPTGQAFTGASPFAMAAASPSHPGNPQPPQLLPGSSSLTCISLSSTSTANFFPATPRNSPIKSPTPVSYTHLDVYKRQILPLRHSSLLQSYCTSSCLRHTTMSALCFFIGSIPLFFRRRKKFTATNYNKKR